ncbi:unnamed protein product [Heligmosomoides polygyrus]|uniref:Secreted protein n=1 Tax=Heligmosomoides polygyrus TaxID=6339 RepID=A0A183F4I0_HELPZ|nr:unnamed protein product [Heligmosomoides polygyrus]
MRVLLLVTMLNQLNLLADSFIVRSYVPPRAVCNSTSGVSCFAELFEMMGEVCKERHLAFKCVHYTWLDECFERRVGKCDANAVSSAGAAGYRVALARCDYRKSRSSAEGTRREDFEGVVEMNDRWVDGEAYAFDIAGWNLLSRNDECSVSQVSYVVFGALRVSCAGDGMELDTSYRFPKSA